MSDITLNFLDALIAELGTNIGTPGRAKIQLMKILWFKISGKGPPCLVSFISHAVTFNFKHSDNSLAPFPTLPNAPITMTFGFLILFKLLFSKSLINSCKSSLRLE